MHRRRRRRRDFDERQDGVHPEDERFINHMNAYFDDWRGHRRYAHHVGDPGPGPNRHRIYRNIRDGKVAGVCAGLADYFGWRVKMVRLALILLTIFFFPMPIFIYAAAAFFMPRGEPIATRYADPEEERFWRNYSVKPTVTFSELRHRFRALDARIADMERAVTSSDYALRKEFRDLERGV